MTFEIFIEDQKVKDGHLSSTEVAGRYMEAYSVSHTASFLINISWQTKIKNSRITGDDNGLNVEPHQSLKDCMAVRPGASIHLHACSAKRKGEDVEFINQYMKLKIKSALIVSLCHILGTKLLDMPKRGNTLGEARVHHQFLI